ncbi:MAG: SDR family NAD(P)-dependent oxidoreductase, partial [Actinomycetota bacterium]
MNLDGTSAVVTGGASGIGEASAEQLAALGARVVIADLNEEKGQAVASRLGGLFVRCDVSSEEDGQAAVAAASEMGPLRSLVNSAGLGRAGRTVDRNNDPMPQSDFEFVIKINLLGSFNMLRLAAAAMAKTDPVDADGQRGAVVNMASVAAFDGQIGQAAYSASKGGVVGMTLPIARDLSAVGVRVNTIAPGLIDTPIYGEGEQSEQFKAHLGQSVLFPKRLGSSEELAFMVVDLITNPYMNAEVIRVDGGIPDPPHEEGRPP